MSASDYSRKVSRDITKSLMQQYFNNVQKEQNSTYQYGKISADGNSATLPDGTTMDILNRGRPGQYSPIYKTGAGQGIADVEEQIFFTADGVSNPVTFVFCDVDGNTPRIKAKVFNRDTIYTLDYQFVNLVGRTTIQQSPSVSFSLPFASISGTYTNQCRDTQYTVSIVGNLNKIVVTQLDSVLTSTSVVGAAVNYIYTDFNGNDWHTLSTTIQETSSISTNNKCYVFHGVTLNTETSSINYTEVLTHELVPKVSSSTVIYNEVKYSPITGRPVTVGEYVNNLGVSSLYYQLTYPLKSFNAPLHCSCSLQNNKVYGIFGFVIINNKVSQTITNPVSITLPPEEVFPVVIPGPTLTGVVIEEYIYPSLSLQYDSYTFEGRLTTLVRSSEFRDVTDQSYTGSVFPFPLTDQELRSGIAYYPSLLSQIWSEGGQYAASVPLFVATTEGATVYRGSFETQSVSFGSFYPLITYSPDADAPFGGFNVDQLPGYLQPQELTIKDEAITVRAYTNIPSYALPYGSFSNFSTIGYSLLSYVSPPLEGNLRLGEFEQSFDYFGQGRYSGGEYLKSGVNTESYANNTWFKYKSHIALPYRKFTNPNWYLRFGTYDITSNTIEGSSYIDYIDSSQCVTYPSYPQSIAMVGSRILQPL